MDELIEQLEMIAILEFENAKREDGITDEGEEAFMAGFFRGAVFGLNGSKNDDSEDTE